VAVIRTRGYKYGPILEETVLSCRNDVLISGPNSSGKTRWLDKFYAHAGEVWRNQQAIYIRAVDPMQKWYNDVRLELYAAELGKSWSKLKHFERLDMLIAWVKHVKPVFILDDAHRLAGKKLDAVLQIARAAGRVISTTFAEQRTPITLRMALDLRAPQKVQLASEAPYDYTSILMWLVVIASLFAGMWQLSAIILSMKVLAHGKRTSKQS
jgi:hypothetical protein